jgi:hypothetical protein
MSKSMFYLDIVEVAFTLRSQSIRHTEYDTSSYSDTPTYELNSQTDEVCSADS